MIVLFLVPLCLLLHSGRKGDPHLTAADPAHDDAGGQRTLDLSLDGALRLAEQNNVRLRIQDTHTEVARLDARAAWGAFDWTLASRLRWSESDRPASSTLTGADVLEIESWSAGMSLIKPLTSGGTLQIDFDRFEEETNNSFSLVNPATTDVLSVAYIQPLLRNAWNEVATATQRAQRVRYEQELETLRFTRQRVLHDVIAAYWDLVLARARAEVAESALKLAREQLDRDRRRSAAGVGTEVEVIQSEAQVAVRVEGLLATRVAVRRAEDGLKLFLFKDTDIELWSLGLAPTTPAPQGDELEDVRGEAWDRAFGSALAHRSELRLQKKAIEAAEIGLELAASGRMPQLDLALGASALGFDRRAGDAFEQVTGLDFPTYSVALAFSYPLENRGGRYGERAARQRVRAAKLQHDQLELEIVADVREALRQVEYQVERLRASEKTLEARRRQLEAEEARFQGGLSTNYLVLEFQQDYFTALNSERAARVDFAKARSRLLFAQGLLGESPEGR